MHHSCRQMEISNDILCYRFHGLYIFQLDLLECVTCSDVVIGQRDLLQPVKAISIEFVENWRKYACMYSFHSLSVLRRTKLCVPQKLLFQSQAANSHTPWNDKKSVVNIIRSTKPYQCRFATARRSIIKSQLYAKWRKKFHRFVR